MAPVSGGGFEAMGMVGLPDRSPQPSSMSVSEHSRAAAAAENALLRSD
jgi:hypothetical protein